MRATVDTSAQAMTQRLHKVCLWVCAFVCALGPAFAAERAGAQPIPVAIPAALADLQLNLAAISLHEPGRVGIAIEDLATGMTSGVNAGASLPAASTIKIPVMVEVFKEMERGGLDLNSIVHLEARDRDWGWGDMASARIGTPRTVKQLLWLMITQSDNTAANMLIRRVGRAKINATMIGLGLHSTYLGDYIRSETEAIRYGLRTSPHDMVALLDRIARDTLVDPWSSREMLAILAGQKYNTLLPAPLPEDVKIAHKTGSLHDTLNDVGIVYRDREPYVIAVMTTQLPDLDVGRAFIRRVSRMTYEGLGRVALWREDAGIAAFSSDSSPVVPNPVVAPALPPDAQMWNATQYPPAPEPTDVPEPAPSDE